MADGIYYNQEVTAEMLNGIAHDLGHTSFSGFGTDKFGADALNGITKDLVTAGVLLTGNQCKVARSEDGKIILQDGIIVFANGAKKVISEPLTIEADNGTVIYAYNNVAAGTCTIEVAESFPGDGDYVKLASVGADGKITNSVSISTAKMNLFTGNVDEVYDVSLVADTFVKVIPAEKWYSHKYVLIWLAADNPNTKEWEYVENIDLTGKTRYTFLEGYSRPDFLSFLEQDSYIKIKLYSYNRNMKFVLI